MRHLHAGHADGGDRSAGANPQPTRPSRDALGGVLCRCTGYIKIVDAVLRGRGGRRQRQPAAGRPSVRASARVDGLRSSMAHEIFGADQAPAGCARGCALSARRIAARLRDRRLAAFQRQTRARPVLTAADVPGHNGYGIYPTGKDQPVLAKARCAIAASRCWPWSGRGRSKTIRDEDMPIVWRSAADHSAPKPRWSGAHRCCSPAR